MSFVRSALTCGTALYLIGLLLLFFGGPLLSGGAAPPGREAGWGGGVPSASPTQTGLLLAGLCLGLGLLAASWARASWEETTAVLVICAGGLWVLSPGGMEGIWRLLWQIDWLWEGVLGQFHRPGWTG